MAGDVYCAGTELHLSGRTWYSTHEATLFSEPDLASVRGCAS